MCFSLTLDSLALLKCGSWIWMAVAGYLYVFGSGLLGGFFFENFVVDPQTSSTWFRIHSVMTDLITSTTIVEAHTAVLLQPIVFWPNAYLVLFRTSRFGIGNNTSICNLSGPLWVFAVFIPGCVRGKDRAIRTLQWYTVTVDLHILCILLQRSPRERTWSVDYAWRSWRVLLFINPCCLWRRTRTACDGTICRTRKTGWVTSSSFCSWSGWFSCFSPSTWTKWLSPRVESTSTLSSFWKSSSATRKEIPCFAKNQGLRRTSIRKMTSSPAIVQTLLARLVLLRSSLRFLNRKRTMMVNADAPACTTWMQKKLVQDLRSRPDKVYSIVCDNLKRVYPAKDGNPPKYAVRTFSLAVARGECVGILGPNGAGKTSSINMVCSSP